MTILTNIQPTTVSGLRQRTIVLYGRLRRLVNDWVAAIIAHRERQAALYALHGFDDRQLKDIGLYRCQLDETLERAAQLRRQRGL
jgi:uncharacterized protein YjiS (DUF1127 family)